MCIFKSDHCHILSIVSGIQFDLSAILAKDVIMLSSSVATTALLAVIRAVVVSAQGDAPGPAVSRGLIGLLGAFMFISISTLVGCAIWWIVQKRSTGEVRSWRDFLEFIRARSRGEYELPELQGSAVNDLEATLELPADERAGELSATRSVRELSAHRSVREAPTRSNTIRSVANSFLIAAGVRTASAISTSDQQVD
jgi:hypothetical protein